MVPNRLALPVTSVRRTEFGHPGPVILRATAPGWVEGHVLLVGLILAPNRERFQTVDWALWRRVSRFCQGYIKGMGKGITKCVPYSCTLELLGVNRRPLGNRNAPKKSSHKTDRSIQLASRSRKSATDFKLPGKFQTSGKIQLLPVSGFASGQPRPRRPTRFPQQIRFPRTIPVEHSQSSAGDGLVPFDAMIKIPRSPGAAVRFRIGEDCCT